MKKFSFFKIASLALVCVMLLGAFMFTTFANDESADETVEIVSQNVYFDDKLELMFAVNAPAGHSVTATVNGEEVDVVLYLTNPTDNNDVKVADYAYKLVQGVVPQAIDTVVTFTVTYGETTVSKDYSVLQYIYERINVSDNKAEGEELVMFEALLAYADAANAYLDGATVSFNDYKYVTVVDGTLDGYNTTGMFAPDATPFGNIETTLDYDNSTHNVEWSVSVDGGEAVNFDNDEIKNLTVTGNMTVTAVLVESECIHDWSDATCTTLSTCSKCGETTGELAEHTWVDATCETPKTCSVCGATEGELAEHTWGDWTVTSAATCVATGSQTRECTVCGETETETIPATNAHVDTNSDAKCDGCGGIIVYSYTLVTDVNNLRVGDKVIIVASDSAYAMSSTQNTNNRGQVAVTKNGNDVSFTTAVQILTLEAGTTNGTFAFYTGSGYLYAASSSSNNLKTETELSANSSWKITIADGVASVIAQGTYTRNVMQHNSSSGLFACYSSASQKGISIYEQTITVTCAHENLENVTTIDPTCSEKGSTSGTCVECGETVTVEIDTLDHTDLDPVDHICDVCGAENVSEHVDADGDTVCDNGCGESVVAKEIKTESVSVAGSTGTLSSDSSKITWTGENATVVNAKGSTAIRTSDSDHYRVYANSTLTISCEGMTQIVITTTSSSYATVLANGLKTAGATATVSGSTVTVTVTSGTLDEISFTPTAQTRINNVEVTYEG